MMTLPALTTEQCITPQADLQGSISCECIHCYRFRETTHVHVIRSTKSTFNADRVSQCAELSGRYSGPWTMRASLLTDGARLCFAQVSGSSRRVRSSLKVLWNDRCCRCCNPWRHGRRTPPNKASMSFWDGGKRQWRVHEPGKLGREDMRV